MTTVQLAITDSEYLRELQRLLSEDGEHRVVAVDRPSPSIPGVIVAEGDLLGDLSTVDDPRRFVVVESRRAYYRTSQLWNAGFRRVVFANDPPIAVYLAILSTEQSLTAGADGPNGNRGLLGPFELSDAGIDAEVDRVAGVYLLGQIARDGSFQTSYVGRSDANLNNQLHVHVGRYNHFQYEYCPSSKRAFETECAYYHRLQPEDNAGHPRPTTGFHWLCPHCAKDDA